MKTIFGNLRPLLREVNHHRPSDDRVVSWKRRYPFIHKYLKRSELDWKFFVVFKSIISARSAFNKWSSLGMFTTSRCDLDSSSFDFFSRLAAHQKSKNIQSTILGSPRENSLNRLSFFFLEFDCWVSAHSFCSFFILKVCFSRWFFARRCWAVKNIFPMTDYFAVGPEIPTAQLDGIDREKHFSQGDTQLSVICAIHVRSV